MIRLILLLLIIILPVASNAQDASISAFTIESGAGDKQQVSISLQILAIMTMLTLLPALLLTMTSFTRIIVVLAILRQALGMPQTPSNQILIGLALFLTLFIMAPVFSNINEKAVQPYLNEEISPIAALEIAKDPIKTFMMAQTRVADIDLFKNIKERGNNTEESNDTNEQTDEQANEVGFANLIPAFVTSELKTAFQIGFLIFIPFLIIDLVVASVLMAMGMMMLSPLIISLPFKIMLFVLIDGWSLIMGTLASSFG